MLTMNKAYEAVRQHEVIRRDAAEDVLLRPGDAYPQGDVIVVRLDVAPARMSEFVGRQLAPGDTQGSRHTASGDVALYTPDAVDVRKILNRLFPRTQAHSVFFFGPTVLSRGGWTMTHPEHGDRTFTTESSDGTAIDQIVYQRSCSAVEGEIRRQQD